MRYFLFFLLLSVGIGGLACSPYFPNNYFYQGKFGNGAGPRFAEELRLIAAEQKEALAPYRLLRPGTGSTLDAEKADFLRQVPFWMNIIRRNSGFGNSRSADVISC